MTSNRLATGPPVSDASAGAAVCGSHSVTGEAAAADVAAADDAVLSLVAGAVDLKLIVGAVCAAAEAAGDAVSEGQDEVRALSLCGAALLLGMVPVLLAEGCRLRRCLRVGAVLLPACVVPAAVVLAAGAGAVVAAGEAGVVTGSAASATPLKATARPKAGRWNPSANLLSIAPPFGRTAGRGVHCRRLVPDR